MRIYKKGIFSLSLSNFLAHTWSSHTHTRNIAVILFVLDKSFCSTSREDPNPIFFLFSFPAYSHIRHSRTRKVHFPPLKGLCPTPSRSHPSSIYLQGCFLFILFDLLGAKMDLWSLNVKSPVGVNCLPRNHCRGAPRGGMRVFEISILGRRCMPSSAAGDRVGSRRSLLVRALAKKNPSNSPSPGTWIDAIHSSRSIITAPARSSIWLFCPSFSAANSFPASVIQLETFSYSDILRLVSTWS